jgi:hypothetical protein
VDLTTFRSLLTPAGQEALAAALALQPGESGFLHYLAALRRRLPGLPAGLAQAALETAILRGEAAAKFPAAGQMYFTRPALEQASAAALSKHHTARLAAASPAWLLDLGCSIGADTLAFARRLPTLGLDLDPLRLAMAQANLAALGLAENARLLQADLTAPLPLRSPPGGLAAFFDPARRAGGRRIHHVEAYQPPLSAVRAWLERIPALAVKLSPGVELAELAGYDAEIEFISLNGELKEAVLWFGPLASAHRRATLLPSGATLAADVPTDLLSLPLRPPQAFLYEPDPAVLRAGLVAQLGQQLAAAQLEPATAYLTAETKQPTPFARVWAVEDWLPFNLKKLRAYLRERNIQRVTVKKRGSPLTPEGLIAQLRLPKRPEAGAAEVILALTRLRLEPAGPAEPIVIVCRPTT